MTSAVATQFLPAVAAASATKDFVVVSLHDVAPATQAVTERMLAELTEKGIRHCSLLVVPNYHHQSPSMQNSKFVSWLRQLEAVGHEIVIHGYFHERPKSLRETFVDKIVTRFYTEGEGEFYDLNYDEALRRITAARDEFQTAGLKPHGFIAPAWLLSEDGKRAARDAEMEYTTHLGDVVDLRANQVFSARSLVYSVRNSWRRAVSLAWNGILSRAMKDNSLMRLGIHPPDHSHPAVWRQILNLAGELGRVRTPTTYQDWIADQRVKRAL